MGLYHQDFLRFTDPDRAAPDPEAGSQGRRPPLPEKVVLGPPRAGAGGGGGGGGAGRPPPFLLAAGLSGGRREGVLSVPALV